MIQVTLRNVATGQTETFESESLVVVSVRGGEMAVAAVDVEDEEDACRLLLEGHDHVKGADAPALQTTLN